MKFGYTIIWVDDVVKTVEFYEKAFGLVRRTLEDRGRFMWAEMETGDTTLAFSSSSEAHTLFPKGFHPNDPKQPPALIQISLIAPDVASAYMKAMAMGATGLDLPKPQPWGQTIARVRDPNGVLVSLVSRHTVHN
ncbi:MAG: VOC family protein [Brasilonema sp.]